MAAKRRKGSEKKKVSALIVVIATGGVLLALLLVALLVGRSMLDGWLRGEGFRTWLAARTGGVLRAEVSVEPLEWSGTEVYTKRFAALGREEAGFSEIVLEGIRARTGGIAGRAVRVPGIEVNRLDVRFSPKRKAPPAPAGEAGEGAAAATATELPEWLRAYLPDRVEIDEIGIATARVSVEKAEGEVFRLQGTRAKIEPDFNTGFWAISGKGGKINLPDQPELELKDLALRWKGSDLFLDRAALGIFKKGHIEGKGEFGFEDPGLFDLELEVSAIDVDDLLKEEWRPRLGGIVSGPIRITGAPDALVYEGTLALAEGVLEGIPVLERIARYTRSERFKRLVLSQAKTDFKREGDRLELRQLVLQSDGLVRVEGDIDLVGDQISGALQVGVTPGTMRWIPGAERLVFTTDRDGYLWAPLNLSGSLAEPREDLSVRLLAAAGEAVLGDLPADVIEGAKGLLDPGGGEGKGGDLLEQGKKMLDLLGPLLKAP